MISIGRTMIAEETELVAFASIVRIARSLKEKAVLTMNGSDLCWSLMINCRDLLTF